MTTQIGASVFVDPSEITHSVQSGSGVLTFGPYPTVRRVDLFFDGTAGIDAVIAGLVALRAEMTGVDAPEPERSARSRAASNAANARWAKRDAGPAPVITDGEPWTRAGVAAAIVPAPSGMQAPAPVARVITDSERTCPERHPGSGAPCHRGGDHGVHQDTNGDEWADGDDKPSLHQQRLQAAREGRPEVQDGPYAYIRQDA